jgi:hypothetical protein
MKGLGLQKEPRIDTTKNSVTSCQQEEKSCQRKPLIWLHPAGAVIAVPIDQSKVTIPRIEIGKGWQNLSITTEH